MSERASTQTQAQPRLALGAGDIETLRSLGTWAYGAAVITILSSVLPLALLLLGQGIGVSMRAAVLPVVSGAVQVVMGTLLWQAGAALRQVSASGDTADQLYWVRGMVRLRHTFVLVAVSFVGWLAITAITALSLLSASAGG